MRRILLPLLALLLAYSLYSLLSFTNIATSPPGVVVGSSGWPIYYLPIFIISFNKNPFINFLVYLLYILMKFIYEIARLLSFLIDLLLKIVIYLLELLSKILPLIPLPVPLPNASPGPPISTATRTGLPGAGSPTASSSTPVLELPPLLYALVALIIAAIVAISLIRRRGAVAESAEPTQRPQEQPQIAGVGSAESAYSPPSISESKLAAMRTSLIKLPLEPDLPPIWPVGALTVEPLASGVELRVEGCGEVRGGGPWEVVAATPCKAKIVASLGDRSEVVVVKFVDLHREIANTFYLNFRAYPPHMTAREILSSKAPPELIEIFEKAAYSNLPLTYADYASFYRALKGIVGDVKTPD